MDWVFEMVKQWDHGRQLALLLGIAGMAVLGVTLMVLSLSRTFRVMIAGYPPRVAKVPPQQECNSDENLTGLCLKPGGCKTTEECTATIDLHNAGHK